MKQPYWWPRRTEWREHDAARVKALRRKRRRRSRPRALWPAVWTQQLLSRLGRPSDSLYRQHVLAEFATLRPLVIICESSIQARNFCRFDCDPPRNDRDRSVFVITHERDVEKLRGVTLPQNVQVEVVGYPRFLLAPIFRYIDYAKARGR